MSDRNPLSNEGNLDSKSDNNAESTHHNAVDVSGLSTNRDKNPQIGSRGRGPIIINDPDSTILNEAIFENADREYYDRDQFR
ncbi:hypothetical protein D0469_10725 [Peribacillus saganii]|uniref:Uncharacterized protein n=1 Tax=Peribacillus saganii TaxID=2303992 RepID=A0A372LN97_9BACI|nr:hypothetical protein [Peribacillus saganii]RFU68953.1 hypothetical protein D0469_10725 [Peribacillus saganii]